MAYHTLSPQAWDEFRAGHSAAVVLDVRGQNEYEEGNMPGSVLLPHWLISLKIHDVVPEKSTPVMVYCRSGARSSLAAHTLDLLGYEQVYHLDGGYEGYLSHKANL